MKAKLLALRNSRARTVLRRSGKGGKSSGWEQTSAGHTAKELNHNNREKAL